MKDFVVKNGKELRKGHTTGSCATAAATASAIMLFSSEVISEVKISLPSGEIITLEVCDTELTENYASCAIIKDSGDDPDVTNGIKINARVSLIEPQEIVIDGGDGVGRVTQGGLQCAVGTAAINPTPQKMIRENLIATAKKYGYTGGFDVTVSVPQGAEVAKKTFNERLGIVGGISILGTTGIVEPMSEKALVDTIKITVDKLHSHNKDSILLNFGNYSEIYCRDKLGISLGASVQISNYVGESLDYIRYKGFENIFLVGHIGKMIKLAGGIMNTHSSYADCRMELIATHAALCGADTDTIRQIMSCINTDTALDLIEDKPYYNEVLRSIAEKISFYVNYRLKKEVNFGFYVFANDDKHIFCSENAKELQYLFKE